jgi:hypothetical protein
VNTVIMSLVSSSNWKHAFEFKNNSRVDAV